MLGDLAAQADQRNARSRLAIVRLSLGDGALDHRLRDIRHRRAHVSPQILDEHPAVRAAAVDMLEIHSELAGEQTHGGRRLDR